MTIQPTPVEGPPPAGGWASFAGTALALTGVFDVIWGLAAITDAPALSGSEPVWASLVTWGWILLALGVLKLAGAGMIVARRTSGAMIALVLGVVGAVASFLTIGPFPLWSGRHPERQRPDGVGGHGPRRAVRALSRCSRS